MIITTHHTTQSTRHRTEDKVKPSFQPVMMHVSRASSIITHATHAADVSHAMHASYDMHETHAMFCVQINRKQTFLALLLLLKKILQRKKRKRRFWVKDIFRRRAEFGEYRLFSELYNWDHKSFKSCFRLSSNQFDYILRVINLQFISVITSFINFPCRSMIYSWTLLVLIPAIG